ncbi:MAG TPA: sulfatase [Bryobacteraceae bacterium]|jgi:arylsulfatase A-like enzyme
MMNRRAFLQRAGLGAAASLEAAQLQQRLPPEGTGHNPALNGLGTQYKGQPAGHHIPDPEVPKQPNILWIFGDQFRAQALSFNGDPNSRTPNLQRSDVNGVNFTANLSGFPLCCPFRGSLLTSRYPHHCVPGHEYPLPEGQKTIADVFNENGYDTAYVGKWHLGGFHEYNGRAAFFITDPNRRGGFQHWTGYENNNSQWDCWVHGGSGKDAFHYRLPGYETDALTDLTIDYLKKQGEAKKNGHGKPFFAVLSVQPPHDPFVAPAKFMANYEAAKLELRPNTAHVTRVTERARTELAGYYAQIENLDWNYGRIIQALTDTGQLENTHVFFFADHGDSLGSHGMFRKVNPYEEAIRTPMIISGGLPTYDGWKRGRLPVLSNAVDIAPTTLGLCNLKKPEWMEGTDYSHYRVQKPPAGPEPDSAYLQNVIPVGHPDSINTPYRGLVTKDGWKFVAFENQSWLMFNLNEDPYEEANLAQNNAFRAERKRLLGRLSQWVADTGDKFELPSD